MEYSTDNGFLFRKLVFRYSGSTLLEFRSYWPILFPGGNPAEFVSDYHIFSVISNVIPGNGKNGIFATHRNKLNMMAILINQ